MDTDLLEAVKPIETVDDVVEALKGTKAVATLLDCDPRVVSNWRKRERLPLYTFAPISRALNGRIAPLVLWGISEDVARALAASAMIEEFISS